MKFAAIEDARNFLKQNPDIDMIELFILDANGVPRGKLLHREELLAVYESGRPLPSTILGLTVHGEDVENSGLVWKEDIDPGEPVEGNGYAQAKELLPTDWLTSLTALENSAWARDALGQEFLGVYLAVKRAEYRQFMAEVGEQDWRWYLTEA